MAVKNNIEDIGELIECLKSNNIPFEVIWPSTENPSVEVIYKAKMSDKRKAYGCQPMEASAKQ